MNLKFINNQILILWLPTDMFHSIKNGNKMAEIINKNLRKFIKLDVGYFKSNKTKN
jgi:hypothetical protein